MYRYIIINPVVIFTYLYNCPREYSMFKVELYFFNDSYFYTSSPLVN